MSLVEAIRSFFAKYADFSGRARRSEYWWVTFANSVIGNVLYAVTLFPARQRMLHGEDVDALWFGLGTSIYVLYTLALLQPGIALMMRRLHDTGRSGWTYFMVLIPIAGPFIVLYYLTQEGTRGDNAYGPDPKA
jgi:uncharacterized membrane protein YhaH (DUF805 family)